MKCSNSCIRIFLVISLFLTSICIYSNNSEVEDSNLLGKFEESFTQSDSSSFRLNPVLNEAPYISILKITTPAPFYSEIGLEWKIFDPDGDSLTTNLYYSEDRVYSLFSNEDVIWYEMAINIQEDSYLWDLTVLKDLKSFYSIKLNITDGELNDERLVHAKHVGTNLPFLEIKKPIRGKHYKDAVNIYWQFGDYGSYGAYSLYQVNHSIYYSRGRVNWVLLDSSDVYENFYWYIDDLEDGECFVKVEIGNSYNRSSAIVGPFYISNEGFEESTISLVATRGLLFPMIMAVFVIFSFRRER